LQSVDAIPLLRFEHVTDVIARDERGQHTVVDFLRDVRHLVGTLPDCEFVLNFCQDRYQFLVTFAASLIVGKVSLLPSTRTPAALRQIQEHYPSVCCVHDGAGLGGLVKPEDELQIPLCIYSGACVAEGSEITQADLPAVPCEQIAAFVFTSGSTGLPVAHPKTWRSLVLAAEAEASVLGLNDGQRWSAVGTVPSQHQYGLESLVMLPLQCRVQIWAGHPFYPLDIATALVTMPAPRILVTTPVHLRAILASDAQFPPLGRVLSATAPLAQEMALQAEQRLGAVFQEKYGCTETGLLASRRSAETARWTLFPGVRIEAKNELFWASGAHITTPMPLADILRFEDAEHFVLEGRNSDLVNISGKRSSLGHLNHQLLDIPGVEDGCMFVPENEKKLGNLDDTTRVCAIVVTARLSAAQILHALRKRVDPAFLPRPIIVVPKLPRNDTGKLPQSALLDIYRLYTAGGAKSGQASVA
jgi:acyl-coenzyme A synthetase/AMP-(fatty) acid ligase